MPNNPNKLFNLLKDKDDNHVVCFIDERPYFPYIVRCRVPKEEYDKIIKYRWINNAYKYRTHNFILSKEDHHIYYEGPTSRGFNYYLSVEDFDKAVEMITSNLLSQAKSKQDLTLTAFGKTYRARIRATKYMYPENLALSIETYLSEYRVWEPFSRLTVNLPDQNKLNSDEGFLDVNQNWDIAKFVEDNKLGTPTGKKVRPEGSYVTYPLYKWDLTKIENNF